MVKILKIDAKNPQANLIEEARDGLASGGLVIVPTETVYGIACNPAVPGALEKLIAAKGREGNKPMARLVAHAEQVAAVSINWTAGLQRLAETFWPGPLTIVLKTLEGWEGYRVPNHAVALALAKMCKHTLALTSANLSNQPDTQSATEAIAAINADLALDSGPSATEAIPSSVVKVDGNSIECLREGCIPFKEIVRVFKGELHI